MEGTKFGNANSKVFHAFDENAASARIPVFHLGGQLARYFANVYVADFVDILGSCSEVCRDVHSVTVFTLPAKYGVCTRMYTN